MKLYLSNDGVLSVSDFHRGADFKLALRCVNRDEDGDRTPIDLTGLTLTSHLRKKDGTLVATLAVTITDAVDGKYQIVGTPTVAWPLEDLYFDVLTSDKWWALERSVLRVKDSATGIP